MQLPIHSGPLPGSKTCSGGGLSESRVPSFGLIDSELCRVKALIHKLLAEAPESISRLLGKVNICSGKMIRPGLVLLSYRAVRDGSCAKGLIAKRAENAEKSPRLRKSAITAGSAVKENQRNTEDDSICTAAIVELVHNATLLHDDVIDEGQKRRGQPTVNNLWGNESAVLLGDFLLSMSFKICTDLDPEITNIIARTAVRVCEGELRQVTEKQNWHLSESEYIDIITEKSAVLFSSCCLLGGLLAGADETQIRSLADFGLNTGIAFQITDDLLDIIGDESKTGKTAGSDVANNKLTLAVIHLLKALDDREQRALINSFLENPARDSVARHNVTQKGRISNEVNRGASFERDTRCEKESLLDMLGRFGSLEYAHGRAQEFIAKALNSLTDLKEGKAKDALIETAKFAGGRAI